MKDLLFLARKSLADIARRESLRFRSFPQKTGGDGEHLRETIAWLERAAAHGEGGMSSHYSLMHRRWQTPFPETTGYIIPTFYDYSTRGGNASHAELAMRLTDWLGEAQLDNGACMRGNYDWRRGKNEPIVFNTGQNIFGFLRAYQETGYAKYLDNARRA